MKSFIKKHRTLYIIISIVLLSWYISNYWLQFALIQGDSMLPSYHNWQLVFIDKHTKEYDYGDVIVFTNDTLSATLTKRIIALPGDIVQIQDGIVYVNQTPSSLIREKEKLSYSGIAVSPITLAADEYFVLGDNYEESKDSRFEEIGCVKQETILGKILN